MKKELYEELIKKLYIVLSGKECVLDIYDRIINTLSFFKNNGSIKIKNGIVNCQYKKGILAVLSVKNNVVEFELFDNDTDNKVIIKVSDDKTLVTEYTSQMEIGDTCETRMSIIKKEYDNNLVCLSKVLNVSNEHEDGTIDITSHKEEFKYIDKDLFVVKTLDVNINDNVVKYYCGENHSDYDKYDNIEIEYRNLDEIEEDTYNDLLSKNKVKTK